MMISPPVAPPPSAMQKRFGQGMWLHLERNACLIYGGIFLLLLAARLLLVARVASVVPFWDEWDPNIIPQFLPPFRGAPGLGFIFAHHNEHLIALTRLYELALFWLQDRQWHILTETIVNQIYYCGFAVLLTAMLSRGLSTILMAAMFAVATLLFVNPFGWEAIGWAFESQIYFCIILSVISFWLLAEASPVSVRFWCGIAAALLSALSFGAGMVTLLVAIILVSARHFSGRHRREATAAAAMLAVTLAAITLSTPYGNDLHHHLNVIKLTRLTLEVVSWPRGLHSPALVYWPAIVLLAAGAAGWLKRDRLFCFTAAICVWQTLISLQLAISRPEAPITPRYTEMLVVGIVVNLACVLHLVSSMPRPSVAIRFTVAVVWIMLIASGLHARFSVLEGDLANKRFQDDAQAFDVARYLKTGDMAYINPPAVIPYHTPAMLAVRLKEGQASGIFPASLLDGDTPRRDKWRKQLRRVALMLALAGLAGLGAGLNGRYRQWQRAAPEPAPP